MTAPSRPRVRSAAGPGGRWLVVVLASLSVFGPLSMDLYLPSLPELGAGFGVGDALAQATMTACMIGLGLGQLVAGPLSDRFGRRIPLLVGVGAFAVLSLACAFAWTIELLLVLRFLQGSAGAAGIVIAVAVARDLHDGVALVRVLSLLAAIGALAPVIAPIIGGQLALLMDWRGIFVVLAAIGAVLTVVAAVAVRETLAPAQRHTGGLRMTARHFAHLARDRRFVLMFAIVAAMGTFFFGYLTMSSFVLQTGFGVSPQLFSLLFAVNAVATMLGAQANRMLVGRLGPRRALTLGIAGAAVFASAMLIAVLAQAGLPLVFAALSVSLFFYGSENPNTSGIALSGHGARAGTAAALLGSSSFVAGPLIAQTMTAVDGGASATTMAVTMTAAAGAALLLLVISAARRPRRA